MTPTTAAPAPAVGVAAEIGVRPGAVGLSWTPPVNAGGSPITDYVVQYSSNGGTTWTSEEGRVGTE